MSRLLAAIVLLILYASLFPWNFSRNVGSMNPIWAIFHRFHFTASLRAWGDILLNIGIYMPVGLFGALRLRHLGWPVRIAAPFVLASVLSLSIEILQVYDITRYPSWVDWVCNMLGGLVGAGLAVAVPRLFLGPLDWLEVRVRRSPAASLLLGVWVTVWLFPIIPNFSLTRLYGTFHAFVTAPWPFLEIVGSCFAYCAAGLLLQEVSRRHTLQALALALFMVPAQLVMIGRQPRLAQLAGAVAGWCLILLYRKHEKASRIVALALCALVVLRGLEPFRFSMSTTPFEWVPLAATLTAERVPSAFSLLEKCWWYGSVIWLLHRAGSSLWRAAGLVAVILGSIEAAQMWLPGRTPESTDPLLALAIAAVLWRAEAAAREARISAGGRTARAAHPESS